MAKDAASKTQITSVGKRRRLKTAVQELMQQSHTGDHSRGRLDHRSRRHRGSDLSVAMSHQDPSNSGCCLPACWHVAIPCRARLRYPAARRDGTRATTHSEAACITSGNHPARNNANTGSLASVDGANTGSETRMLHCHLSQRNIAGGAVHDGPGTPLSTRDRRRTCHCRCRGKRRLFRDSNGGADNLGDRVVERNRRNERIGRIGAEYVFSATQHKHLQNQTLRESAGVRRMAAIHFLQLQ
jgi:hypothetical protein